MDRSSNTEKRVESILSGMRKAMPEIKRQIEVYENSLRQGKKGKLPKIIIKPGNV